MEHLDINLVLILAIIIVLIIFTSSFVHKRQKTSSIVILDRIREINEYASHEINYVENFSHEEAMKIFTFIKRKFSITVIGKVKIGINMDNVKVSVFNKNLYISIPEIKIISHETKTSGIGFQTKNPFFPHDFADYEQRKEEMKTAKGKEILQGILQDTEQIEKIYEDFKKKITTSLLALPHFNKKFTVHYKTGTPILLIEDKGNATGRSDP